MGICFTMASAQYSQPAVRFFFRFAATFLGFFLWFSVYAFAADEQVNAVVRSNQQNAQIDFYRSQIAELESQVGPFSQALIEPLGGLSDLYIDINNLEQANMLLNRQLQLMHIIEGPDTFSQIPLIEKLIANNIRMNKLGDITDNFEHIQFVYGQNPESTTIQKLQAMDNVRHWNFTAFNLDEKRNRISYFRNSREILRQMLSIAEDEFGQESSEIIPYLYKSAIEKYHLLALLFSHDELGKDAYDDIFEVEQTQPSDYLRQGYNTVKDIREIVQQSGDVEADAMAAVYEGDFQMLLGIGLAQRSYREAMGLFAQAGKSEREITDFFSRPVVLPVTQYYLTMKGALDAQDVAGYRYTRGEENEEPIVHLGNFFAWNESILNAAKPAPPAVLADFDPELHRADVRFTIYSRGNTRTPDVESSVPDTVQAKVDGRDAVETMIFRPRFKGNRWRSLRGATITFWYPPEKQEHNR